MALIGSSEKYCACSMYAYLSARLLLPHNIPEANNVYLNPLHLFNNTIQNEVNVARSVESALAPLCLLRHAAAVALLPVNDTDLNYHVSWILH